MPTSAASRRAFPRNRGTERAFTLIELLAVMTLIAIFAGVLGFAFMRGGGATVGLQGAQSSMQGLLTLVRGQAAVSGRNAGLFINVNTNNPDRYLRFVVPVVRNAADNGWLPLTNGTYLPSGVYIVPSLAPSGPAIEAATDWSGLNSTILAPATSFPLLSSASESWSSIVFTPRGTIVPTPSQGNIVVAAGRPNAPGAPVPFTFVNPESVRGIAISVYGLTRLILEADGL